MIEFKIVLVSAACGVIALLAQTTIPDTSGIRDILTTMGPVGILAWYFYFTQTSTIPKMLDHFRQEIKNEREVFAAALAAKDAQHEREISEWRLMLKESLASDRRAVHDIKDTAGVAVGQAQLAVAELKQRGPPDPKRAGE